MTATCVNKLVRKETQKSGILGWFGLERDLDGTRAFHDVITRTCRVELARTPAFHTMWQRRRKRRGKRRRKEKRKRRGEKEKKRKRNNNKVRRRKEMVKEEYL